VRFAAASAVAVFHLSWRVPELVSSAVFYPLGWIGVQVFFVLSGYVIAASAVGSTPQRFLESRIIRLYPAALACWALNLLVTARLCGIDGSAGVCPAFHSLGIEARFSWAGAAGSLFLTGPSFLTGAYWTMPIELAFYAVILAALSAGAFHHFRRIAIALVLWSTPFIAATGLAMAGLPDIAIPDLGYGLANATLLRHGCYFGLGMLIWLHSQRRLDAVGWVALAGALLLAAFEIGARASEIADFLRRTLPDAPPLDWLWPAALAVWLLACAAMALTTRTQNAPAPRWAGITRVLGLATFPLYLLHEAIGGGLMSWLISHGMAARAALAAGLAGALLASIAIVRLWERPVSARARPAFRGAIALVRRMGVLALEPGRTRRARLSFRR
jgi:peptidoglycan/LPS O-acetylase OafA/YrhL